MVNLHESAIFQNLLPPLRFLKKETTNRKFKKKLAADLV